MGVATSWSKCFKLFLRERRFLSVRTTRFDNYIKSTDVCNIIMSYGNICISSVLIFAWPLVISPLTFLSKCARFTHQFTRIIFMTMFTGDSGNYLCPSIITIYVRWNWNINIDEKKELNPKYLQMYCPPPRSIKVGVCYSGQEQVQYINSKCSLL